MRKLSDKILHFIKKEAVLTISGTAAIITMFIMPPNKGYLNYIDFRVLALLFCLMAAVAGFADNGVFLKLSCLLLNKVKTIRSLGMVLVLLCFVCSMWITNDVSLITFVPFAILILNMAGRPKQIIKIVVLQTIAANLGSMLTPVGNPQNLRLFTCYDLSITDFMKITMPYAAFSLILILAAVLITKNESLDIKLEAKAGAGTKISSKPYKIIIYSLLFLLSLACVIRLIDYRITFIIVLAAILVFDRKILRKVDYCLLLTFVFFFIFVGNIGSIPAIRDSFGRLLSGREFAVSVAASQIISNVPAAVLLSAFSSNYKALILGTNIGGLGTLVASLASLISYKLYCRSENARPSKYLSVFTLYNLIYLTVLCLLYILMSK